MSKRRKPAAPKRGLPKRDPGLNQEEAKALDKLDRFAKLTALMKTLPTEIVEDIKNGASTPEIYKKYESLAAARVMSVIVSEQDSGKALSAAKDVLDRVFGKPTEKKEVKHVMQELPDDQLDALILSELEDLSEDK